MCILSKLINKLTCNDATTYTTFFALTYFSFVRNRNIFRYAQSAPGSPAGLRYGVAMTTVADSNLIARSTQQQATVLAPATSLSINDSKRNQVIWPLQATSHAAGMLLYDHILLLVYDFF